MSTTNTSLHQLFLVADHLKLSLLERQRAVSLNLEPTKHDPSISRSLSSLRDGLEQLERAAPSSDTDAASQSDVARLRKQYDDLAAQFHTGAPAPASTDSQRPNDPSLAPDFAAAKSRPRRSKNVRFRDDPNAAEGEWGDYHDASDGEDDEDNAAARAALFSSTENYRDDEPAAPDHSALDNVQIHAYHTQVLREQDAELETLGQSIGRQRMLGIQMGTELEEQNELLADTEAGVDRHVSTLDRARRRLGQVARKGKNNWSWVTIGILIVVLVLLIIVLK